MKRVMTISGLALCAMTSASLAAAPMYTITNIGTVDPGDFASQGLGASPGGLAFGTSPGSNQAFTWTAGGGLVPLPNDPTRPFSSANGANDSGIVVGTGATTFFGSDALPLQWTNGTVSQLPILAGSGVGRANDVNGSGIAVGSNGGGSTESAVYWDGGLVNQISATTTGGSRMTTAFRVNDAGVAVGVGLDPNNAARNVGLMYDIGSGTLTEVPALPGDNGAIAFDVSQNGFVVGTSSFNQSGSTPFIWDAVNGSVEIPVPPGAGSAIARGVNSNGWVVGVGSGQFAVPFLYDGTQTYSLQDLIPAGSGWDLDMNTSSAALGIAEDGSIVGTGIFNGEIRAFHLSLVPAPGATALLGLGAVGLLRRRR